jgi:hypothetical protein
MSIEYQFIDLNHGLINYIDTKLKCRRLKENQPLTCSGQLLATKPNFSNSLCLSFSLSHPLHLWQLGGMAPGDC